MPCTNVDLQDLLSGNDLGGSWVYDGFNSIDPNGTPSGGGSSIPALTGDNPSIDITGFIEGYYFFTYSGGGAGGCGEGVQTKFYISNVPSAGLDNTITYCTEDTDVLNLQQELGGTPVNGGAWNQIGGTPNPVTGFDANAGTLDLSQITTPGTFQFEYSHTSTTPTGFGVAPCSDCTKSGIVTVTCA